jgi:hypothetical protein
MADTSAQFTILVPNRDSVGNSAIHSLAIGPSIVERILISFPPGASGLVFAQLRVGGEARYPNQLPNRFYYDGYVREIIVSNSPDTGAWDIFLANDDSIDHTIQVEIDYNWLTNSQSSSSLLPVSL